MVGLRLLVRARRGWPAPELTLALYFLVERLCSPRRRRSWSTAAWATRGSRFPRPPAGPSRALLAFAVLAMAIGAGAIYVFTWKTFRPERGWAKAIVMAGCACLAIGYAIEALVEGFAPVMFAGPGTGSAGPGAARRCSASPSSRSATG